MSPTDRVAIPLEVRPEAIGILTHHKVHALTVQTLNGGVVRVRPIPISLRHRWRAPACVAKAGAPMAEVGGNDKEVPLGLKIRREKLAIGRLVTVRHLPN